MKLNDDYIDIPERTIYNKTTNKETLTAIFVSLLIKNAIKYLVLPKNT